MQDAEIELSLTRVKYECLIVELFSKQVPEPRMGKEDRE